jgi:transposase
VYCKKCGKFCENEHECKVEPVRQVKYKEQETCPQCGQSCIIKLSEGLKRCANSACMYMWKPGYKVTVVPAKIIVEKDKK